MDRLLHRAEALLFLAIVVGGQLKPRLTPRLDKGVEKWVFTRPARYMQRAIRPAPVRVAAMAAVVPAFHPEVVGQHVGIGPAVRPLIGPMVEIPRVAPHIDHAIDRGRPADHLAARTGEAAVAQMRLRLRPVAPVICPHVHRVRESGGHLYQRAHVGAAELQHQHGMPAVFAEARSHRRPGGAGAHNHKIRFHGPYLRASIRKP